jgi:uncharacterized protein YybS (DUF2232 family)
MLQALPPPGPNAGPNMAQLRGTAILAAGTLSALAVVWLLRGMPLGSVLMWLSPLPLYACALAFGASAAAMAAAVAAVPLVVLGSFAALAAHGLTVGLPVVLTAWLALSVPPGAAPRLGPPVVALALLAAALFLAAAWSLADHPGGLHGALAGEFTRALRPADGGSDAAIRQFADLMARIVPLTMGLWFLGAMAVNAALGQRLANRFGLLARPPVLWRAIQLPRWYAPLPILAALAALLLPEGPRFVAGGVAEILVLPFFLLGLAVVHSYARTTRGPRLWLGAFYLALLLISAPVLFIVTGLGFADQFSNLRGRIAARANSGNNTPEDRNR